MLALLLLPRLLPKLTDDIDDDDDDEAVAVATTAAAVVIAVFVKVVWAVLVLILVVLFDMAVFGRENKFFVSIVASPLSQTANAFNCLRLFFVFKKLLNSVFFSVRASFM